MLTHEDGNIPHTVLIASHKVSPYVHLPLFRESTQVCCSQASNSWFLGSMSSPCLLMNASKIVKGKSRTQKQQILVFQFAQRLPDLNMQRSHPDLLKVIFEHKEYQPEDTSITKAQIRRGRSHDQGQALNQFLIVSAGFASEHAS